MKDWKELDENDHSDNDDSSSNNTDSDKDEDGQSQTMDTSMFSSSSQWNNNNDSNNKNKSREKEEEEEAERLSSDLALFLSNPTLKKQLADGSLNLASYSSTIDSELSTLEQDCIEIYRANSNTIASLRLEMDECDSVLASLQEMLLGFRADLGGLSGDIRALQDQSRTLGIQLRNRRDAELGLRRFLERVVVPPNLADVICTASVDSTFVDCVLELERKFRYVHLTQEQLDDDHVLRHVRRQSIPTLDPVDNANSTNDITNDDDDDGNRNHDNQHDNHHDENNNNQETLQQTVNRTSCGIPPSQTIAGKEMQSHITKLRLRAVARSRTYFLQTIAQLRRPKTNVRMIQINSLLKYAPLMDFLLDANPEIYTEIKDVYVESMAKTLHALFRTYAAQLALLDNQIVSRKDVIAVDSAALRDVFSTKVNMNKRGDSFFLGDRVAVLDSYGNDEDTITTTGNGKPNTVNHNSTSGTGNHSTTTNTNANPRMTMNMKQKPNTTMPTTTSSASPSTSASTYTPILAHVALAEGETYPYEVIFKSIMMHLMDAATNEYVFIRQFFKEHGPQSFFPIFGRTLSLILEQLENYLFNCYDCLGLLLMIKITHANRRIMRQRKVLSLDKFFESVTSLLWPRLKSVVDKQLRSVRDADAKKLGMGGGGGGVVNLANSVGIGGGGGGGTELGLHAHYVSRRYAEFTCSILLILNKGKGGGTAALPLAPMTTSSSSAAAATNHKSSNTTPFKSHPATTSAEDSSVGGGLSESSSISDAPSSPSRQGAKSSSKSHRFMPSHRGSAGDMLMNDLSTLLSETVQLLERLADGHTTNKKKIVFLINNLDQIISIFQERRITGVEMNRFVELLMQQRELFVEEELLQSFSKMIAFVHQTEQHMARVQLGVGGTTTARARESNKFDVNVQVVESLVREFSSTWKQGIEQINRDVLSYFSNFRNGMEILKQVLTQLLLYYTRFQDIIRKVWRSKPPAFCKDLVSTTVILTEIKKYALAI